VLSGQAISRIEDSVLTELIFTDTIPYPDGGPPERIKYETAAPLFAEAIQRTFEEVSISTLFR
jgi:ribose-phosphate pyrophosphokinase